MLTVPAALVLVATTMIFLPFPPVEGIEEAFCAGLGYSDDAQTGLGLISMGATPLFVHPLNTIWGANAIDLAASANANRADRLAVHIYGVKQIFPDGTEGTMNGWLHLEISRSNDEVFRALAVQAITDNKMPFGEFVHLKDTSLGTCTPWKDRMNYIPCSAVPVDTPWNPNMFAFTSIPGSSGAPMEIKLLWRASVTYCNKPKSFRFIFATNSEEWETNGNTAFPKKEGKRNNLGPMIFTTGDMEPKFYGAASPRFTGQTMTCDQKITNMKPDWLRTVSGLTNPDMNWFKDRWNSSTGVEDTSVTKLRATCKADWPTVGTSRFVAFGGRCEKLKQSDDLINSSPTKAPECLHMPPNFDADDNAKFKGEFATAVQKREDLLTSNCDCPTTPTAKDVKEAAMAAGAREGSLFRQGQPKRAQEVGCEKYNKDNKTSHKHGLCVTSESGKVAYSIRRWHAIFTLFFVLVANPAGAFIARYFKGAIPVGSDTEQPVIPIKHWYIAHILLIIPVLCVFVCASAVISRQRVVVGFSSRPFAGFHRVAGQIYTGLFIFQILTGFLRPLNIKARWFAIFIHWLIGVILIYGGLILCILTYRIPASPTSSVVHLFEYKFKQMHNHPTPMILLVWGLVDIMIHLSLTIRLIRVDKKRGVERTYFPVFLPVPVKIHNLLFEETFQKEARYHQRCFILYVIFCVSFYVATLMSMTIFNDYREQGFGDMYCTHHDGEFVVPYEDNANQSLVQFFIDRGCGVIYR